MGQRRNLHPDAPMWMLVIIEVYEQGYPFTGIINGLETVLAIDNLRLEYTVYTLCNSVVGRLVILRHAGQAIYCLAPDFFLIWMPCSSAISMSVFRAITLS